MKQTRLQKFIAQHKPRRRKQKVWIYKGHKYKSEAEVCMAKALDELGFIFTPHFKFDAVRRWEADFRLPWTVDSKLPWNMGVLIEVNGSLFQKGGHSTGKGLQRDYEKARDAALSGYRLLPFSSNEVMDGRAKKFLQERLLLRGM